MRWWLLLRLVLCIGSIAPAGCLSSHVACDCVIHTFLVSSGVPMIGLAASGTACSMPPRCFRPLDGGQCDQFAITFTAAGTCHFTALAADGRQGTFDETVSKVDGCCTIYRGPDAEISLFPAIDGGPQPIDAASDTRGPDVADAAPTGGIVPLLPDSTGWVDRTATGSTNIQGRWYSFADGFGADGTTATGACEMTGQHAPAECSQLTTPSPGGFPNVAGKMCTAGVAARVINVVGSTIPDYNKISGAGIALSFNLADMTATPRPYNAFANGVRGIAFDIDNVPAPGIRVQFPTATAPNPAFWGGFNVVSPVVAGHNEVLWTHVEGPFYDAVAPAFDPTTVLRVEFLVPTNATAASPFSFCVSNLSALLQ
jgi:hypothetical protein